jgi:hypothetical protein
MQQAKKNYSFGQPYRHKKHKYHNSRLKVEKVFELGNDFYIK